MSSEKPQIPNSLNEHWMPFTSNKDFKENPKYCKYGVKCKAKLKCNFPHKEKDLKY